VALGGVTVALITLDALGTIIEMLPPVPRLRAELRARGAEVDEGAASAALREEIAFYRAHHAQASDAASLAALRERCAEVLRVGLERAGADLEAVEPLAVRDALLAALTFRAYPDVPDALRALRDAGHTIVVVSNWDVSLHDALRSAGLTELLDGAVSSAEAGFEKPDPRIFAAALELAGTTADGALHAGDTVQYDVAGARAAGWRAVLVARAGTPPAVPPDVPVIASLAGLPELAA
jgi:putative hydrolase of the HAD superfamily